MPSAAFYNYRREPSYAYASSASSTKGSITSDMESDSPPAGFFSTFSIVDPKSGSADGASGSSGSRSQKRNRRVFVCIPCHKRKLKCDKGLPCGRCVAYGAIDDCVYQPLPSTNSSSPSSSAAAAGRSEPSSEPPNSSRASSQVRTRDRYLYNYRPSDGRCRAAGASHWTSVCAEFEEACPYIFSSEPEWEPRFRQIKNLKYLFPSLAGANFPFGNSSPYVPNKHDILNSLPPRAIADVLLRNYMMTFEKTHRMLHPAQFQQELEEFWADRESVLDGWLAQLCTMMALGCQSAPEELFDTTGNTATQWADVLLDGAQTSLCRSPFMLMPSLTTIRTMCMMATCKMMGLRGTDPRQVASLMALVVRLAMSLQLHQSPSLFYGMPEFEAEMRRRIWTTVQLLDLDVAMWAGTTPTRSEGDAEAPLSINDSDIRPNPSAVGAMATSGPHGAGAPSSGWAIDNVWATHDYTDGVFQNKLADMLPLLIEVMSTVNSPTTTGPSRSGTTGAGGSASSINNSQGVMDNDRAVRLDKRIRQRLKEAEVVLGSARRMARPEPMSTVAVQHQFLRVLVHRTLLSLHHALARDPHPVRHEQSLGLSLESAMMLLSIQQYWITDVMITPVVTSGNTLSLPTIIVGGGGPGSAASSPGLPPSIMGSPRFGPAGMVGGGESRQWLLDLCHDDFGVAAMHVVVGLRRGDFDECAQDGAASADAAASAVRHSLAVARSRACRSLLQFKEFTGLSMMVGCLRGVRQDGGGNRNMMLAALMEVAADVEDVILTGKSDMIWSSASAAAGGTMAMSELPHHSMLTPQQQQQQQQQQQRQQQQHGEVAGPAEPYDTMMGVDFPGSFP
ncbi:hypothetical protein RB597_008547 [Gaeumannomyces tritici]